MPANPNLPPTCEIRDWVVFGPGYWRGALYTPADCERVPRNFQYLRGYINPVVKLGHDKDQTLARLKSSEGWLNLGDFKAVTPAGNGRFAVTLTNVPTEIGQLVNAGRIRSGSVELIPFCDDPKDQGKRVEGPIITGVALLGEEHPTVKGFAPPRAVFADGTPVPPARDLTPWFEAMAQAAQMSAGAGGMKGFSDDYERATNLTYTVGGKEYPLIAVCFSEFSPMLDEAFLKGLGLTPDQIGQILAKENGADAGSVPPVGGGGGGGTDALPPPPPADDKKALAADATAAMPGPAATPVPDKSNMNQDDQTMMSAKFSEMEKRLGAMEKKYSDAAKAADEKCMASYSDQVERVLKANAKRIAPNMKAQFKQMGLSALTTKNFADVTNDGDKAFAAWEAFLTSLPESDKFSADVEDKAPEKKPALAPTPGRLAIVNSERIKVALPGLHAKLVAKMQPSAN